MCCDVIFHSRNSRLLYPPKQRKLVCECGLAENSEDREYTLVVLNDIFRDDPACLLAFVFTQRQRQEVTNTKMVKARYGENY